MFLDVVLKRSGRNLFYHRRCRLYCLLFVFLMLLVAAILLFRIIVEMMMNISFLGLGYKNDSILLTLDDDMEILCFSRNT